jgi:hypothetical protein
VPTGIVPVGVYEKFTALHVVPLCELIVAIGLTVTVTLNARPVQLLDRDGVTLYTAVAAAAVVFTRLSVRMLSPDSAPAVPERPVPSAGELHA